MPQKVNISNLEDIRRDNPRLAEALESLGRHIGAVADQTTATVHGTTQPPPPPDKLDVKAAGGIFEAAVTHNAPIQRGANYFLEYSTSPSFAQAYTLDMGASRNERRNLGNQTLYFRARVSYPTSPPSDPIYFGSAGQPTAVVGGGSVTGPNPLPSQGTGTSSGANGGDGGFGNNPDRGNVQLPQVQEL